MILEASGDINVVGEADNGHDAIKKARELRPRVVLLDLAMPLLNGVEAARQLVRNFPEIKILVLSTYSDTDLIQDLIAAGITGYVTKETASTELLAAVREVARGNTYFGPAIAKGLLDQSRLLLGRNSGDCPRRVTLTSREMEVLQLVAEGHANKQIADLLSISIKTVEKHRQSLMAKLDIHETASLTRYAVSKSIVRCDRLPHSLADTAAAVSDAPSGAKT
jgi:DNA-binding NarL/FixJ family response regulator